MKFLITVVIVLCGTRNVNGSFFEFISSKVSDIFTTFENTMIMLREHVRNLFQIHSNKNKSSTTPLYMTQYPPDIYIKKTFSDFVEMTAAENETELHQYASLKSEPTALMSTPQLALLHGRRVESHIITTKDGYLLTAHRISPALNSEHKFSNQTIILHHGLLGSSADWILLGSTKSLPYLLSDAGYDVWMANARGNYYSRGHTWRKVDSIDFWNFSFQQIGEFDLAALIDYIRKVKDLSNQTNAKIDFVGHSMGATALLVLLSTSPHYNEYLRIGVLLAPLAYMTNVAGPLKSITDMASNPPEKFLELVGFTEFLPTRRIPTWLAVKYCKGSLLFCCNPLYFISNGISNMDSLDNSFIAALLYHVPAGGSTATLLHYVQLIKTGKFNRFNDTLNEFNLNQVTLPIVLISSDDDWLATIPDVLRLYFSIANPIDHYIIRSKNFSHTEFVWGQTANDLVFNKVFEYLDNGLNWFSLRSNEVRTESV